MQEAWKKQVSRLKQHTFALYIASRDSRVPWYAKLVIGLVVAYALSPVDLIPDFIPIIGYIDDLLFLPVGVWFAIRLIPDQVWKECEAAAQQEVMNLPRNWKAGFIIILIWALAIGGFSLWAIQFFNSSEG